MKSKEIINNGLKYSLNTAEKTVNIIGVDENFQQTNIIIPRSINIDKEEYIIKSISDNSFKGSMVESIQFEPNSEVESIGHHSITYSRVQQISLPSNIIKIEEDWCSDAHSLKSVTVMKTGEENIKIVDNKILVGKSNPSNDTFDILILGFRDIDQIIIPPYIKRICEYAFQNCRNLQQVEITENSSLQSIGDFAFYGSSLKKISLPSNISDLGIGWCCGTVSLTEFNIVQKGESNFKYIDNKILLGKTNPKSDIYDIIHFAQKNIEEVNIPSQIKEISPYAFDCCGKLQKVEFPSNSELEIIGKHSFASCSIREITIPSHVKKIGEGAFCWCTNLLEVKFSNNSEIHTIEKSAFHGSIIRSISIQSSISDLKEGWCSELYELKVVNVIQNNEANIKYIDNTFLAGKSDPKKDAFDILLFARRSIKQIVIPPYIKRISDNAFEHCYELEQVEITEDSELQYIGEHAFVGSQINSIFIPKNVTHVGEEALSCTPLQIIEIHEDSLLNLEEENDITKCDCIVMVPAKFSKKK